MTLQLMRINDVTFSVANLHKIQLAQDVSEVRLFVKHRPQAFVFNEETPERATALYVDVCKLIRSSKDAIPFLSFGVVTMRLDLVSAINVEKNTIVLTTTRFLPEIVHFDSEEAAKAAYEELMASLGVGTADRSEKSESPIISEEQPKPKKGRKPKPPEQVPRKAAGP